MYILTGNKPILEYSSPGEKTVEVALNGVVLYNELATPINSKISIDVRRIVANHLDDAPPTGISVEPTDSLTVTVGSDLYTYYVVDGGIDSSSVDVEQFLTYSFLTWQAQEITSFISDPRYLKYVAVTDCSVKLKCYFAEDNYNISTLADLSAGQTLTANLSHSVLAGVVDDINNVAAIDVFVESNGDVVSYVQRFIFTAHSKPDSDLFVFKNSLGGFDAISFTGSMQESVIASESQFVNNDERSSYSQKSRVVYTKNCGHVKGDLLRSLSELLTSSMRYYLKDGRLRSIVLSADQDYSVSKTRYNYGDCKIEFMLSDTYIYHNVSRGELPAFVTIDFRGDSFSLAPRLYMFPHASITEELLLLTQSPYSQEWKQLSFSSLLEALMLSIGYSDDGTGLTSKIIEALANKLDKTGGVVRGDLAVEGDLRSDKVESLNYDNDAGYSFSIDDNGNGCGVVDFLEVRKKTTFKQLEIDTLRYVGGSIVVSDAGMTISKVESCIGFWRCYFFVDDGATKLDNHFELDDLVRLQSFNIKPGTYDGVANRYYWRAVTGVGDDYIDISISDCDKGSDNPMVGDKVVQLGNKTNINRQGAHILSSRDSGGPSIRSYRGICDYTLLGRCYFESSPSEFKAVFDTLLLRTSDGEEQNVGAMINATKDSINLAVQSIDNITDNLLETGINITDKQITLSGNTVFEPSLRDELKGDKGDDGKDTGINLLDKTSNQLQPYASYAWYYMVQEFTFDEVKSFLTNDCYLTFRVYISADDDTPVAARLSVWTSAGQTNYVGNGVSEGYSTLTVHITNGDDITTLFLALDPLNDGAERHDGQYKEPMFIVGNNPNVAWSPKPTDVALNLGYDSYAQMVGQAKEGKTVISGGYINTELIDAKTINGEQINGQNLDVESGSIGGFALQNGMIGADGGYKEDASDGLTLANSFIKFKDSGTRAAIGAGLVPAVGGGRQYVGEFINNKGGYNQTQRGLVVEVTGAARNIALQAKGDIISDGLVTGYNATNLVLSSVTEAESIMPTNSTIIIRASKNGCKVMLPHKNHVYQILGYSEEQVALRKPFYIPITIIGHKVSCLFHLYGRTTAISGGGIDEYPQRLNQNAGVDIGGLGIGPGDVQRYGLCFDGVNYYAYWLGYLS